MPNERLLTAAKLAEQLRGDMSNGPAELHEHTGLVPENQESEYRFLADIDGWRGTELSQTLEKNFGSSRIAESLRSGDLEGMTQAVGITEQELDASSLRLPIRLLDQLDNNDAPAFLLAAGNPNTGKTNTMLLLAELRSADVDNIEVIANFGADLVDHRITSAHDLAIHLLENPDRPSFVIIDEGSTHFDARTKRRDVAEQWTPLAKRFAKLNVDAAGIIVHTGKDLHPEAKRLGTLPFYKSSKKTAEFFERWPADLDMPTDRLFGGELQELQPTGSDYDPDDAAPWLWNLEADVFSLDLSWSELLDELRDRGPTK